jgi:hypothetical protein
MILRHQRTAIFMADADAGVIVDLTVRTGPKCLRLFRHKYYGND